MTFRARSRPNRSLNMQTDREAPLYGIIDKDYVSREHTYSAD